MNTRDKTKQLLLAMIMCVVLVSFSACGSVTETYTEEASDNEMLTDTGYNYVANVEDDKTAYIQYLGAELEITGWEWEEDDFDDSSWFCLKMLYTNDMSDEPSDDYDEDLLSDCLDASFWIQGVQNGEVIYPRGRTETETIEEDNVYQYIDEGRSLECEYWFPVDSGEDLTIQVLNIDGQDTVMAEITYEAGENHD